MNAAEKSKTELLAELESLRDRLARSEETLQAIQQGEVDALVVSTPQGERVFTLQSADRSYRLLVEDMQQGAATLSSEGLILSGNRSFADLLKQPLEKLIGSQFQRFLSPIDLPLFQTLVQQAERGERHATELFLLANDATEIPIYLAINHLNLGDSSINCLVLTDLTEQKRHEKTLASERLGHLILEQAGEAILVCDHTGQIIQASQVASQLLGKSLLHRSFDTVCPLTWIVPRFAPTTLAEAIAQPPSKAVDHARAYFAIALVLQGEQYQGLEVELNQEGQRFNLVLNARTLNDQENHFRGAVVILTDITRQKQAETALREAKTELEIRVTERTFALQQANDRLQQELLQRIQTEQQLRQSEARYRAIVEDQTEMIVRFSLDSTILFVNDAYCRFFQIQRDEIIGKSYNPVIYEADREKVAQLVQSISAENPVLIIENRVLDGQGAVRWTQWVNRLLFDAQGKVIELQAVGRDITTLKQIEQALRESEERLQLALEASGDGIWDWDITTNEIYYSPQYFQMLGYAAAELPQLISTWENLVHPEDMVWVKELLAGHLHDRSVLYKFDYRLRTKTGEWKWIADYGKVMTWDENGQPLRMIGTHRDVNDRKSIEAALRQSEEQRRLALDLTHIGFWDLHIPSDDLTWNENHFTLLGMPVGLAAPQYENWRDRIYPEDVKRVEQLFAHSIKTHTDYEAEYRVVEPNGSIRWLMARGRAIYDEQNQPLRSLGVLLDISDHKQSEAALQESSRRWRSLLDNVQLVVIGLDIHGNVEYANPFFLTLTGYQLKEVLGKSWFDNFLTPGQRLPTKAVFRAVLEHNSPTPYQNPILTKAGEERIIAWSNTTLRDVAGRSIGTISIGEDITERRKIERMKAEFISVVSHELRTPLTSMQAALSLLSEKIIDPTSKEGEATIQIATEGTDRLVRLVSDILDLERLESGKVRLEKHLCNAGDLVETAMAQMQEMAKPAEITLKARPYAYQVEADSDRLLQVLTNLLSNAIKFSPNRSVIQLAVELKLAEETPHLLFTVCDEGRGIPADNLESIFDRFHQVDASDSREKGGTGLGLAICRSIVQQHGGKIWAESTMGKGSTFYFTIPMTDGERSEAGTLK
ncbi:MAG: PAS domain S-box protein [Stenomitos frigidus ULC029]